LRQQFSADLSIIYHDNGDGFPVTNSCIFSDTERIPQKTHVLATASALSPVSFSKSANPQFTVVVWRFLPQILGVLARDSNHTLWLPSFQWNPLLSSSGDIDLRFH